MIPVQGHTGLYRDSNNAIVSMNDNAYNEYLKSKNKLIENQEKLSKLENEISEIKSLLNEILKNK